MTGELIERPDWVPTAASGGAGVPVPASGYDSTGLPIAADDQPLLDSFAEFASATRLSQRQFRQAVAFWQRVAPSQRSEDSFIEAAVAWGWNDDDIVVALSFADVVRKIGGVPVVVPDGSDVASELRKIETMMRSDRRRYHSEGHDARYRQLLALQSVGG